MNKSKQTPGTNQSTTNSTYGKSGTTQRILTDEQQEAAARTALENEAQAQARSQWLAGLAQGMSVSMGQTAVPPEVFTSSLAEGQASPAAAAG